MFHGLLIIRTIIVRYEPLIMMKLWHRWIKLDDEVGQR